MIFRDYAGKASAKVLSTDNVPKTLHKNRHKLHIKEYLSSITDLMSPFSAKIAKGYPRKESSIMI